MRVDDLSVTVERDTRARAADVRAIIETTFITSLLAALERVEEVGESERADFDRIFLAKHPHLESFVRSPSCVPLMLRVSVYMVVTHFQHVIELHVDR